MSPTPAQLGYRMPAEWEPHEATWIAWPHNREDWPGKFAPVPWVYVEIVRHLSRVETVNIVVNDGAMQARRPPTGSSRGRRPRPSRVLQGGDRPGLAPRLGADVRRQGSADAEGTGRRRPDRLEVQRLGEVRQPPHGRPHPARGWPGSSAMTAGCLDVELDGEPVRVVLEGGAIDVNGRGTLLTTEECLLSEVQARNPGLDREALEQVFADYLGVRHVIWLGRGIDGDDTHGHVDDLARFVDPRHGRHRRRAARRATRTTSRSQENLRRLQAAPRPGRPAAPRRRRCRCPSRSSSTASGCRPATPTSTSPTASSWSRPSTTRPTAMALDTLAELFPDREVVGIHAVDLVLGLGTLHCLSQQQPRPPA